jgi:uncharacterized protein YyaL (SSP411 family)
MALCGTGPGVTVGMNEMASSHQAPDEAQSRGVTVTQHINLLAASSSAYLRSAMRQPVQWMEWGEAAFDRAAEEDKPILLDIGAVWCHWCHVMDRESYEDPQTAQIINDFFVAVKVDRDERPDVDTRYQAAVSAISGQGGWPLTAFLTPQGKPYFGGTYFPPEDRHGRPSFQRVLLTMAEAFMTRRSEVDESAGSVMLAIEQNEAFSGHAANPGPDLVDRIVLAALKSVDMRHGGFGGQPKFPHSSALNLLIDVASRPNSGTIKIAGQGMLKIGVAAKQAAMLALEKMAQGGIHDQLAGGFHRYSVDEHWIVPHFEKMAYDNCALLQNYVRAYSSFGVPEYARVARGILRWMDGWLSDRELGGFYASQDADFSLEDDGDYFTWTLDETREVLTPEELAVVAVYFEIGEIGDMQHNVAKNVLRVKRGLEVAARKAGVSVTEAAELLEAARDKMYAARLKRPTPYVDKTIYVAWNSMCISAYLEAGRTLGMPEVASFALKSLDRTLEAAWSEHQGVAHVVAYGEAEPKAARVAGMLDDYVFLGLAALDAWEATGDIQYYKAATAVTGSLLERFYDADGSAFFDTEKPAAGEKRLGALGARRKPLQDSPTPAGNPMAAILLMRVGELAERLDYIEKAQGVLETFAGVVEHFGLYASTYALALQQLVHEPIQVCVVGTDAKAREMEAAALSPFMVNKSVLRLPRIDAAHLPPLLKTSLPRLPKRQGGFAVVCSGHTCQPPINNVEDLTDVLKKNL